MQAFSTLRLQRAERSACFPNPLQELLAFRAVSGPMDGARAPSPAEEEVHLNTRSRRMSRLLRGPALSFLYLFILAALPALAQVSQQHVDNPGQTAGSPLQVPVQPAALVLFH